MTRFLKLILLSCVFFACGSYVNQTALTALSDESLSAITTDLYSQETVLAAQEIMRQRLWTQVKESDRQSELRAFACLLTAQALDQSTTRGERSPESIPCLQGRGKCQHLCKKLCARVI